MITEQDKLKLKRIAKKVTQLSEMISTHEDIKDIKDIITDRTYWYAIARGLEIIGETSKGLSSITRESHADFPWFTVEHLRDLLNHGHFKMERGDKAIELKEKIIADIRILKEMIDDMIDDEIASESSEKKKEKSGKTDARTAHEKLLGEQGKNLRGFREAGLYLDLSKENKQLTVGDLRILKSRMRRPTFDLMLIQAETRFILNCLEKRNSVSDESDESDDILQLTLEYSIGIIGQSMREIRDYHPGFIKKALLRQDCQRFIELRNRLLHLAIVYTLNDITSLNPKIMLLLENVNNAIIHRTSIVEQLQNVLTSESLSVSEEKYPQASEETTEIPLGMDFDDDLFEVKEPKGLSHKWEYGYYSDDDELAEHFFQSAESSALKYDETMADISEIEKVFEEDRERKRAIPSLQLFTEDKKEIEDVKASASARFKPGGL